VIKRFDLSGAANARGVELLSAPDGPLPPALLAALVHWADTAGQPFQQHYLWGYLDSAHLALLRVSPIAGSTASTVQALVLAEAAVLWASNVTTLLSYFPPAPSSPSTPCVWRANPGPLPIQSASVQAQLYTSPILQDVLTDLATGAVPLHASAQARAPEAEIRQLLGVFSAIPLCLRRSVQPRFATNTAPRITGKSLRLRPAGVHAGPCPPVHMLLALLNALPYFRPDALSDMSIESQWRTALLQSLQSSVNSAAMAPATQFLALVANADTFDTAMRAQLLQQAPPAVSTFAASERARWLRELQAALRAQPSPHIPDLWVYQLFLRSDNLELITPPEQVQLFRHASRHTPAQSPFAQTLIDRICTQPQALALLIAAGLQHRPASADATEALSLLGKTRSPDANAERFHQLAAAARLVNTRPQPPSQVTQEQVRHMSESEFFARLVERIHPTTAPPKHDVS
jgi:hypothetical protein